MKKLPYLAVAPILLTGALAFSHPAFASTVSSTIKTERTSNTQSEVITIKDPALAKDIRAALKLSDTDPITSDNILNLTELRTKGSGILDLSGLEFAKNLTTITFDTEKISSLAPLENLTKLNSVGVPNCPHLPMSEVLRLKNLTALDLSGNKYDQSEFSKLSTYSGMTELWLNNCNLNTTNFMSSMKHLMGVQVNNNNLTTLEGINTNSPLKLQADNNNLTFIDFSKLNTLTGLSASNNQISELDSLNPSTVPNLQAIRLNNNNLSGTLDFKYFSSLVQIFLDDNNLTNLTLHNLPQLKLVHLYNNNIQDIYSWENLPLLSDVDLGDNNNFNNLEKINKFTSLTNLGLGGLNLTDNQIVDLHLPKLIYLQASANKLTSISFVKNFPSLQTLEINKNSIANISDLPKSITSYTAKEQAIELPNTKVNTTTTFNLKDRNGNLPILTNWIGEHYINIGENNELNLEWLTRGDNSFHFSTSDNNFSGIIKQKVS